MSGIVFVINNIIVFVSVYKIVLRGCICHVCLESEESTPIILIIFCNIKFMEKGRSTFKILTG